MKVWITKYALTKGILESDDAELEESSKTEMIHVPSIGSFAYFHGGEWYTTHEAAQDKALAMIAAKRKSIAKTLAKLDKLEQELSKGQDA